ncbi:MAG: hypothetical protein ACK5PS_08385, partial [Desulfopila sp.]
RIANSSAEPCLGEAVHSMNGYTGRGSALFFLCIPLNGYRAFWPMHIFDFCNAVFTIILPEYILVQPRGPSLTNKN